MTQTHDMDPLINAAFITAESGVDTEEFIARLECLEIRRRRARRVAMTMAGITGGSLAMLFAHEAVAVVARRLPLGADSSAGLMACLLLLLVVGVVADSLATR